MAVLTSGNHPLSPEQIIKSLLDLGSGLTDVVYNLAPRIYVLLACIIVQCSLAGTFPMVTRISLLNTEECKCNHKTVILSTFVYTNSIFNIHLTVWSF